MLIRNGALLHGDRLETNCDLRIENGRIQEIDISMEAGKDSELIDAAGSLVFPGLIDLHTHGLGNVSVQDDSLREYSRLQFQQGVTGCIATIYGSPEENIACMKRSLEETRNFKDTANILGFRPEIMYVRITGAGSPASPHPIDQITTESVYEASEALIRVWDVSPEQEGALQFIAWAEQHSIVTSMAHTGASIDEARAAVEAGVSLVTHLYDTFDLAAPNHRGVYPAGLTDYIQIDDRLTVEIIPDGIHVHPLLVEKTFRCKGVDRMCFITASLRGSGNPPGIYNTPYGFLGNP